MSRWGSRQSEQQQGINFLETLNQHHRALSLLQVPNILDEVKSNNQKFTQLLIEPARRPLLEELIRLAINPQGYVQQQSQAVDKKITHTAIEILTNLSEEFIESVFEVGESQEDEVIQVEKQYPILSFIFKVLKEDQLEETGLAYFSKLITPFIYQRPQEIIQFFSNQGLITIVDLFWSPSVAELISKVLQAENQTDFYEKEKLALVRKLFHEIASISSPEKVERIIQNFRQLLEALVQKHEDKYQKAKYENLIRNIMKYSENFMFLVSHLELFSSSRTIRTELLRCIEALLRIYEPQKPGSKVYQPENPCEPIQMDQQFKQQLTKYLTKHTVKEFVSDIRIQLLNYYKVVKKLLTLAPEVTDQLLTKQFLADTFAIMKNQENNNILHNFQKDVLILGIQHSNSLHCVLQNELDLADIIRSTLSESNSKVSYQHQLFLIGEAVRAKSQESSMLSPSWSDLEEPFKNKRAFYSMLIGGNPRDTTEKWGSFEDDFVLKPLEKKDETEVYQAKHKERNASYQMVSRLDELEGTEVLSQQEEAFPNDKQDTNNAHYFDDLGMPDLPLDSDRSEDERNQGNSFDDLPATLKEDSFKEEAPQDLKEKSSKDSLQVQHHSNMERANSIVAIDLGEPLEEFSASNKIEEEFRRDAFAKSQQKRESNFIDNQAELTVSVNLQDQDFAIEELPAHSQHKETAVVSQETTVFTKVGILHRDEMEAMLQSRYDMRLREQSFCRDEMEQLLSIRYGMKFPQK